MLGWIYWASDWIIRGVMTPIVVRRRQPSTALAWLAVIYIFPWIGLVLYLMVGTRRLGRRRALRRDLALRHVFDNRRSEVVKERVFRPDIDPKQHDIVRLAQQLADFPILGGNEAEAISATDKMIQCLIADINKAKSHVHLLYYIYENDETGARVAQALIEAAKRGVKCRVIVDHVGSRGMLSRMAPEMRAAGVEVVPLLVVNPLRILFARIDLRNHRKLAIIDGEVAYAGSQNIVNPNYGHKRGGKWLDLTLRLRGPVVHQLQLVFLEDWFSETNACLDTPDLFPPVPTKGEVPIQIVPSGPTFDVTNIQDLFVAAIHEAERHIVMTTPYLVPSESLITALRVAALRGVKVDIIMPKKSDQRLTDAAARAFFHDLIETGINIHLHSGGLLHAKTITIDDAFALVGSANFDTRSFQLNFELTLLLFGQQVTDLIRWCQHGYMERATAVDRERWINRPKYLQVLDDLAKLLGPLL
ncbi:MAG TPA: cardiolipin synthase [Phycisphaerales bacterium]|nr:cardiolipin synthase [Phycisphaerales bacterium]